MAPEAMKDGESYVTEMPVEGNDLPSEFSPSIRPSTPVESSLPARPRYGFRYWVISIATIGYMLYVLYVAAELVFLAGWRHRKELKSYLQKPPLMWRWLKAFGTMGLDIKDGQWFHFSSNFWMLAPFMTLYVLISQYLRRNRPEHHTTFHCLLGVGFVLRLHGTPVFFFALSILFNYLFFRYLATRKLVSSPVYTALLWGTQLLLLFGVERFKTSGFEALFGQEFRWLDDYRGPIRWTMIFNFSTLKMISFNYDLWEAANCKVGKRAEVVKYHRSNCVTCILRNGPCYKLRADAPNALSEYNLKNYIAYIFYAPLYIAGPLSSFNAFVSHLRAPQQWFSRRDALLYVCRIGFMYILISLLNHFLPVLAIREKPAVFDSLNTLEKAAVMFYTLLFLWLKFSIIWKLFRLASLLDGTEVPENMQRCFCNTMSISLFWRGWHSSFYIWILRYIYVPLGGSRTRAWSVFPIFGFIALWHDVQLKLAAWALTMCIAFLPEMLVTNYLNTHPKIVRYLASKPYWHFLRMTGCAISMGVLIGGCSAGFGVGTQAASGYKEAFLTKPEYAFQVFSIIVGWFCAANFVVCHKDFTDWRAECDTVRAGTPPKGSD